MIDILSLRFSRPPAGRSDQRIEINFVIRTVYSRIFNKSCYPGTSVFPTEFPNEFLCSTVPKQGAQIQSLSGTRSHILQLSVLTPQLKTPQSSQMIQWQRICLPMQETEETWVQSLVWEEPLEKEMATRSSILVWKISRIEEHGGLQSMGSQVLGTTQHPYTHKHTHIHRDTREIKDVVGWTKTRHSQIIKQIIFF